MPSSFFSLVLPQLGNILRTTHIPSSLLYLSNPVPGHTDFMLQITVLRASQICSHQTKIVLNIRLCFLKTNPFLKKMCNVKIEVFLHSFQLFRKCVEFELSFPHTMNWSFGLLTPKVVGSSGSIQPTFWTSAKILSRDNEATPVLWNRCFKIVPSPKRHRATSVYPLQCPQTYSSQFEIPLCLCLQWFVKKTEYFKGGSPK